MEFSIWGGQCSQNLQGIILEKKIQRQKSSDLQRASLSLQLSTNLCMPKKQLLEMVRWERTHWNHKALPLELINGQEQFMFPLVRVESPTKVQCIRWNSQKDIASGITRPRIKALWFYFTKPSLKRIKLFPSNLTVCQNTVLKYLKEYKNSSTKQYKIHNI